ncbi:hypothetical protein BgiBS90_017350, partial [Biomphalaria glabrata]
ISPEAVDFMRDLVHFSQVCLQSHTLQHTNEPPTKVGIRVFGLKVEFYSTAGFKCIPFHVSIHFEL